MVKTVSGTGRQGHGIRSGGRGTSVSLSSPWDLAYKDGKAFIAMAGTHQIWVYDINSEDVTPFAGSGYEGIVDGNLHSAQFAQPSGLSIDENYLYVADSGASGIRRIDLDDGTVKTIVGSGLFVFGYQDGPLDGARFQHPLGVSAKGDRIFVADTYNHAIRLIDLSREEVRTLVGRDKNKMICRLDDPECDTLGLYEPNDVKLHEDGRLFITDTNNHLVRIYDLERMILKTLRFRA
ncbi:MAG: hypothetical protein H3Z50_07365 [archaeon]|nr:hypothetical protein [archaeon]MCP8306760.1 hypothetical protein [archaeon]